MKGKANILIGLEDVTFEETERFRQIIHTLFNQGVFSMRSGKVTLNFDIDGVLQQVGFEYVKWKRDKKPLPLAEGPRSVIIELKHPNKSTLTQTTSGQTK